MAVSLPRCRLSPAEYVTVTEGYARAAALYVATAVVDDDRAVVDIRGAKPQLAELIDEMIAREGQCCSHLRFAASETDDGYRVELSIPEAPGRAAPALCQTLSVLFPSATIASGAIPAGPPTVRGEG